MPKVLRIINRFNLGGPTYNAAYLTKYMAPEYETLLIGGQQDPTEANSQYILKNLNLEAVIIPEMHRSVNFMNDLKALRKIKGIIQDFKPDIVHTHASKAGALGRRAAAQMKVPVIVHTFHGHVFDSYFSGTRSKFYQLVERRLAKISTQIIALSEIQKNDLVNKYHICPTEKVTIIPLGFDLDHFRENTKTKREDFRKEYLIEDDEIAIGIVGRIVPIKNHKLFLKGIQYLKQHSTQKIRAFIIGDGEDRSNIEIKAHELGLDMVDFAKEKRSATLSFTSWLKNIDQVNAGMDIIALTSLNEGTPVSLIEAQASCKPIVTTRVGGIENIVIPNETALLSDIDDVDGFGKNLLTLSEDKLMRAAFCEKGWTFVSQRFHYTRLVREMKELYDKLLSRKF
jgi:glycosyltransferase involved in cell wall biosynthesis